MTRENTVNVPREPTKAMIEAGRDAGGFDAYASSDHTKRIWSAMLSAAPIHEGEGENTELAAAMSRVDGFTQRWEARIGTGAQTGDTIYCVTVHGFAGEAELRASDLRIILSALSAAPIHEDGPVGSRARVHQTSHGFGPVEAPRFEFEDAAPIHEGEGEDWSELERLAQKATAGPWGVHEHRPSPISSVSGTFVHAGVDDADDTGFSLVARAYTRDGLDERQHNAAFIAAANPATILKLIASARSAPPPSVEVERLREAAESALLQLANWAFRPSFVHRDDTEQIATRRIAEKVAVVRAALSKQEPGVPTPGEWIEWSGGENPVPGERVDVKFSGGRIETAINSDFWGGDCDWWRHQSENTAHHIIAYRIVPTPGGEVK